MLIDLATPLLDSFRKLDTPALREGDTPESVRKLASELQSHSQQDQNSFAQDLYRSILQSSARVDRVSLAVTGLAWLGAGVPSVQQEMMSIIRSARREITICSYSITGGAEALIAEIAEVASQGVSVTLIVNDYQNQPSDIRTKIQAWMVRAGGNFRLFDFNTGDQQNQLHAKVIVADRAITLVGSANFSYRGMVSNHELAVVIRGPIAEEIAVRLDRLKSSAREVVAV